MESSSSQRCFHIVWALVTGELFEGAFLDAPGSARGPHSSLVGHWFEQNARGKGLPGKHFKRNIHIKLFHKPSSLCQHYRKVFPGSLLGHLPNAQPNLPHQGWRSLSFTILPSPSDNRNGWLVLFLPGTHSGFGKEPSAFFSPAEHVKEEVKRP